MTKTHSKMGPYQNHYWILITILGIYYAIPILILNRFTKE